MYINTRIINGIYMLEQLERVALGLTWYGQSDLHSPHCTQKRHHGTGFNIRFNMRWPI